ncbi:MAG: FHA domain-containing protein, partial [Anaerolineales bacterium]
MADSPSIARLSIKTGPDAGKVLELSQKELVIGRTAPAGLIIAHPEVSRRHARVVYQQRNYILEDLGSSNGTFINGQPLRGPQVLTNGVEIQMGTQVRLVFNQQPIGDQSAAKTTVASVPSLQEDQSDKTMMDSDLTTSAVQASISDVPPNLLVTIAGQDTKTYTLTKDRITLGRADDNNIVVASPIMSRHHATLEKTSLGYEIRIAPGVINTLTCQGYPV